VKPQTAGTVVTTLSSNTESLRVEVPSAGVLRCFGYCPRFQKTNFDVEFEFREEQDVARSSEQLEKFFLKTSLT
jgi:hypothetical protein